MKSNKKWELSSPKKTRRELNESPPGSGGSDNVPHLLNMKKLDSSKRHQRLSDSSSQESKLAAQMSDDNMTAATSNNSTNQMTKVSSKPPLSKRIANNQSGASKSGAQRPHIQGWLYKRKHPKLSTSNTSLNSIGAVTTNNSGGAVSSSSSNSAATLIRTHLSPKWKLYWCVFIKDYIVFYKSQDDKTPVDFLLLKDFSITLTNRDNGFILVDRQKHLEHEFYASTQDDFREWYKV